MVAENRGLAAPANVESLPTSAMREDHVSMVWAAACKPRRPTANLGLILAVELLRAARGLGPRGPLAPAAVRGPGPDPWLSRELAAVERLVVDGGLPPAVEAVAGSLA